MEIRNNRNFNAKDYDSFVLGCDVGGTNTNIGIFGVKKKPELLLSCHFRSRELNGVHDAINEAISHARKKGISIKKACIAGAGVVSQGKNSINLIKLGWLLNRKELKAKTGLKKLLFVNDFEAIGYGINLLGKKDLKVIKKGERVPTGNIAVIGAGTGLGKTLMVYDEEHRSYITAASEAGHADYAAQTKEELELVEFIKKLKKTKCSMGWEQVVSGMGFDNIYLFLRQKYKRTKHTAEIDNALNKAELIFRYEKNDPLCRKALDIFMNGYAKFARNCAYESVPFGGIFIAGGIAAKNPGIFGRKFVDTFCSDYELPHLLKKIPVYLVLNYDVGMLGAGFAAAFLR